MVDEIMTTPVGTNLDHKLMMAFMNVNALFCDIGPHAGSYRLKSDTVYLSAAELGELHRRQREGTP
jgi:hypothetical protein